MRQKRGRKRWREKDEDEKDGEEKEKGIFGGKDFADKELCSEEKSC